MKKRPIILLCSLLLFVTACENRQTETKSSNQFQAETQELKEVQKEENNTSETEEISSIENNNPTQERIDFLLDQAMYYYWHGGDLKKSEEEFFRGLTLKGDQEVIEAIFNQVIELDPLNTDYQRSLASTMVINNKLDQAVPILKNVIELEPSNYEALAQYYVYSGLHENSFDKHILNRMRELNPEKTGQLIDSFELVEQVRSHSVPTDIKKYEENHLFVLLGYALDEDGNMQETLENRLQYALKLLEENPTSKIIVTGGVPKKGNTEAKVMNKWLIDHGIDEGRIIQENLATDTVENSLFSMRRAFEIEGVSDKITVVSSASHVRRANVLFEVANQYVNNSSVGKKINFDIDIIGEPDDYDLISKSDEKERLVMYRDLLRLEGFWQYPNLQR